MEDRTHKRLLEFIRKVLSVPMGYSKEDLTMFRSVASKNYPLLLGIIEGYLGLAEESETQLPMFGPGYSSGRSSRASSEEMHLFDLLREKKLFASNADLAKFAAKVLPGIKGNRFDKMSRGDIAARIIEFLETKDPSTRKKLQSSMREAVDSSPGRSVDRKSFVSKWEKIIKGIEL